jgi:hypothetical protein
MIPCMEGKRSREECEEEREGKKNESQIKKKREVMEA